MYKIKTYAYALAALTACSTMVACEDIYETPEIPAPGAAVTITESSVTDGASVDPNSVNDIVLTFSQPTAINAAVSPTLNDQPVTASHVTDSEGNKDYTKVSIPVSLEPNKEYTLSIPLRAFSGIGSASWLQPYTLTFTTGTPAPPTVIAIQPLNNANATANTKAMYQLLVDNYGKVMASGAMGEVGWGLTYTDFIAEQCGKYPAIVGFDYLHLCYSATGSWIDYSNTTPVETAWAKNCLPAFSWHWNVPAEAPGETITIWEGETAMGSWSNYVQLTDADALAAFAAAKVGDVIVVEVKDLESSPQGSFKDGSSWAQIAEGTEWFSITGNFSLQITADILEALQAHGLIVGGQNYTATKVTIGAGGTGGGSYTSTTTDTQFKAANVLVEGTWENQVACADVEKLAGYLQLLQDKDIPLIWRPFHEAAGDYTWGPWFWWGNGGVEVTKQLYIWLHDKLTNEYGLNNLIWAWTMQTSDGGKTASVDKLIEAYPGDEYVDIVGTDIYPSEALTDQSETYKLINTAVGGKKLVALTECGNLIDPEKAYANGALWSYFMQWYDMQNGTPGFFNYQGPDQWITNANSPYVTFTLSSTAE